MRTDIPKEAVSINGTFIEDIVSIDYMTIKTEGREALSRDVNETESIMRDGTIIKTTRFPARTIKVSFYIRSTSLPNLRLALNTLSNALNVENAKIKFNDEDDKYFVGTVIYNNDITDYKDAMRGEYEIYCADPFKYSEAEYTVTASSGQFNVNYNGTYKGYPTLVAEFPQTMDASGDDTTTSQCGYVGYVDQREHVLQFGDPNETDWNDVEYPATVPLNKTFKSTSGWTTNGSRVVDGTQTGSVSVSTDHIYPSSYGTGTGWHGPAFSKIITGESSPIGKNFNFTWKQRFDCSKTTFQAFEVLLWNNDNGTRTLVGGVGIFKTTKDTKCKVYMYVGGTPSKGNYTVACTKISSCTMKKVGSKITFTVGGVTKNYSSSNITDLIANEVTFHFMKKGTQNAGYNHVFNCKLQRLSFDNYEDVANIFMPGDVLTVDTANAGVYLDDGSATIPAQYLGALGNDWEDFYLVNGANTIGVDYSDFTTSPPTFTLKYRERFL